MFDFDPACPIRRTTRNQERCAFFNRIRVGQAGQPDGHRRFIGPDAI
jgi:hypothetical protein